jgi:hypothetical protein
LAARSCLSWLQRAITSSGTLGLLPIGSPTFRRILPIARQRWLFSGQLIQKSS